MARLVECVPNFSEGRWADRGLVCRPGTWSCASSNRQQGHRRISQDLSFCRSSYAGQGMGVSGQEGAGARL